MRVAVIGTGSSAIQSIPVIAEQASHLTVFQRTPNFSIPARNAAMTAEEREAFRRNYPRDQALRARGGAHRHLYRDAAISGALDDGDNERRAKYEARWSRGGTTFMAAFNDILRSTRRPTTPPPTSSATRSAEIVSDPQTGARLLRRNNHPIGTKRICVDTDYFETFNRDNVTLVDIKARCRSRRSLPERRAHRRPRTTKSMRSCSRPASTR